MADEDLSSLSDDQLAARIYSNPTVGKPEWTHQDVAPDSPEGQSRVQDLLATHAVAGRSWQHTAENIMRRFPGVSPDTQRDTYERMGNELKLNAERKKLEGTEETTGSWLKRRAIPIVSTVLNINRDRAYSGASKRYQEGKPEPDDASIIANYEKVQQVDKAESDTTGGAIKSGLAHIPAIVGELAAAGPALRAFGFGAQAATKAGSVAVPLLARAGQGTAKLAAQTVLVPSLWAEKFTKGNLENGREAMDPRGFAPAFALGMLQNAVFGISGKAAEQIGGAGVGAVLKRWGTGTVAGMAGQQVADILGSGASELIPKGYKLQTGYGILGDVLQGKGGDALKDLTVQAVTFAAFSALHARNRPEWDVRNQLEIDGYTRKLQEMAGRGLSAEQAAQEHPWAKATQVLSHALEHSADLSPSQLHEIANGQEGEAKDFLLRLLDGWKERDNPGQQPGVGWYRQGQTSPEANARALEGKESEQGLPPVESAERARHRAEVRKMMGLSAEEPMQGQGEPIAPVDPSTQPRGGRPPEQMPQGQPAAPSPPGNLADLVAPTSEPRLPMSFDVPLTRERIKQEQERRAAKGLPPATPEEIVRAFISSPEEWHLDRARDLMSNTGLPDFKELESKVRATGKSLAQIADRVERSGATSRSEWYEWAKKNRAWLNDPHGELLNEYASQLAMRKGKQAPEKKANADESGPGQPTSNLDETTKAMALGPAVKEVPVQENKPVEATQVAGEPKNSPAPETAQPEPPEKPAEARLPEAKPVQPEGRLKKALRLLAEGQGDEDVARQVMEEARPEELTDYFKENGLSEVQGLILSGIAQGKKLKDLIADPGIGKLIKSKGEKPTEGAIQYHAQKAWEKLGEKGTPFKNMVNERQAFRVAQGQLAGEDLAGVKGDESKGTEAVESVGHTLDKRDKLIESGEKAMTALLTAAKANTMDKAKALEMFSTLEKAHDAYLNGRIGDGRYYRELRKATGELKAARGGAEAESPEGEPAPEAAQSAPEAKAADAGQAAGHPSPEPQGIAGKLIQGAKDFLAGDKASLDLERVAQVATKTYQALKQFLVGEPKGGRDEGSVSDDIKKTFAPATRGEEAAKGGNIFREDLAIMRRQREIAHETLKKGQDHFDEWTVNAKTPELRQQRFQQFTDAIEKNQIASLPPELRPIAQAIRDLNDGRQAGLLSRDMLEGTIENYLGHLWKKPGSNLTSEEIGRILQARRPMQGQQGFQHGRQITTYGEGLAAGLEPVDWNPVRLALLGLEQVDKAIMAHDARTEWAANGLAGFYGPGSHVPDGWRKLEGPQWQKGPEGQSGHWYAPEPVARLVQNYLQPGLRGNKVYDGIRGFGNALNQFQLGFSAFHAGFVMVDTQTSALSLGLQQISRGDVGKGMGNVVKGVIPGLAPLQSYLEGSKLLKEYYAPGSQGAETARIMEGLMQGGGGATMDSFYESGSIKAFQQALRSVRAGKGGFGSALWHAAPALAELFSKPLMEHVVPRMKLGVFAEMARYEMSKLGDHADANQVRDVMGKAWDSVENRLGQMTYDNLFWNRTFKDVAMASVRSVGWNLGTWRELGGGLLDTPAGLKGLKTGEGISSRLAYVAALPIVAGIYGAMYQYMATDKGPEELKDYFFPRTGSRRKDGVADRVALPTYMRDVAHLVNRSDEGPQRVLQNAYSMMKGKVNPALSTIGEMLGNEDFYGVAIRNPNDKAVKQAQDTAGFLLKQMEPFWVRSLGQQEKTTTAGQVGSFVGATPAGSNYTHTWDQQRKSEVERKVATTPLARKVKQDQTHK